jgi:hypothetical protein
MMITLLAPTLPPLGAGAHCDASVLPVQENLHEGVQVKRHYRNRGMP